MIRTTRRVSRSSPRGMGHVHIHTINHPGGRTEPMARAGDTIQLLQPCARRRERHDEGADGVHVSRYEKEFDQVQDVFELQRNLNNAFAYDLVPSTSVITAALRAARRVNDFPTAVRVFEGKSSPHLHKWCMQQT